MKWSKRKVDILASEIEKIAKRSAASHKGWRTRKRMKAARLKAFEDARTRNMKLQEGLRTLRDKHIKQDQEAEAISEQAWPTYKIRALPNPWRKALPPW